MTTKLLYEVIFLVFSIFNAIPTCSASCDSDVAAYFEGLLQAPRKKWAVQMFDAAAKIPSGLLQTAYITSFGEVMIHLGNFDECVDLRVDENGLDFNGQYCQAAIAVSSFDTPDDYTSVPGKWAVCAPSSCGPDGVKRIADYNLNLFLSPLNLTVSSSVIDFTCYYNGNGYKNIDAATGVFIGLFSLIAAWTIFSTVLDVVWPNKSFVLTKSYSLKSNLRNLGKVPRKLQPGQLGCLNGIRVLSTLWIILCHAYAVTTAYANINMVDAYKKYVTDVGFTIITNGALAVDTFFFLSGLLTTYLVCCDKIKGKTFQAWKYYVYRYLRLTPPFAAMIFYLATVHRLFVTGPLWYWAEIVGTSCANYWWLNLLYVTNYFKTDESLCVGQAWYLNVDMQLSFLAPLVFLPLLKWPKYTLWAMLVLVLASIAAAFGVTYVEGLNWTMVPFPIPGGKPIGKLIYQNTPMRAVTYLCGMLLGYALSKGYTIKLPKWAIALGWVLCTANCLTILMAVSIIYQPDYVYEPWAAAFYGGFHRFGWSIGLSWIVWACVNGYAGPVDKILSWKYFVPLSKVSYCAFLVHMDIMNAHNFAMRAPRNMSHYENIYLFFGELVMTIPYTLLLYLLVEAPSLTLLRSLLSKNKTEEAKTSKNKEGNENNNI